MKFTEQYEQIIEANKSWVGKKFKLVKVGDVDWADQELQDELTKLEKSGATGKVLSLEVDVDSDPTHNFYNIKIGGKKFDAISGHHIKIV